MLATLEKLVERYNNLTKELNSPNIDYSSNKYKDMVKEYDGLTSTIELYNRLKKVEEEIEGAKELIKTSKDEEMQELAQMELEELKQEYSQLEDDIIKKMVPKDPNDEKNAIMEIRAGTGGDEAALFVADLFRMYSRFAENNNWTIEILDSNQIGIGGYKEIIFSISGKDVYGYLKYESGVHRVQRIPATETQGRVHTSAASVAVLLEITEKEIDINPNELRIDTYRSTGAGGQHVNTTDSAVRITHIPSGIVVQCQDEKSQHKNKAKALRVLRARLQKHFEEKQMQEQSAKRKSLVGSGDRSEKIRTYNYPQSRVTDHRINLTLYKLDSIMDGYLNEFIEALSEMDLEERIKSLENK